MTKNEYKEAISTLNKWAYAYYTLSEEIASDAMYDELYFKVKKYEETNEIDPLSPTQRVGDQVLSGFEKKTHKVKMYSLDDVFNPEEFSSWALNIKKEYSTAMFYAEPKYDGLSLNITYENGTIVSAVTRGDGLIGEDVTKNVPYILGIPLHIEYTGTIEIRGEVVIFKSDFEEINQSRVSRGKDKFSNERNAASGSLRSFESEAVKASKLRFTPYGLGETNITFATQSESYQWILSQGFVNWGTNNTIISTSNINDIINEYNLIHQRRGEFPMLLDGVVVKVDQKTIQQELGFATKYPKWGIAFKFPADEKITTLIEVINQVGKTGAITPVGIVEPVDFDGVTVSRVTLHNFDEIRRMDIRINDKVNIIRSGDVIPKIVGVRVMERTGDEVEISEPAFCPDCGANTEKREKFNSLEETAVLYCSNPNCYGILKGRLAYAVGKKALDIDDFGESIVNELIDRKKVSKLSDIFKLTKSDLLELDGFKEKKASKLISAIASKTNVEAYRLLNAIDIKNIGERASQKLITAFRDRIFSGSITFDDLIAVEDIGSVAATSFVDYFSDTENINEINALLSYVTVTYPEENSSECLLGKTFVITGTLTQPRKYFEDLIQDNGGKLSGSVSKKTSYVLAGSEAGSKLEKAESLGVNILDEDAFFMLIQ